MELVLLLLVVLVVVVLLADQVELEAVLFVITVVYSDDEFCEEMLSIYIALLLVA